MESKNIIYTVHNLDLCIISNISKIQNDLTVKKKRKRTFTLNLPMLKPISKSPKNNPIYENPTIEILIGDHPVVSGVE